MATDVLEFPAAAAATGPALAGADQEHEFFWPILVPTTLWMEDGQLPVWRLIVPFPVWRSVVPSPIWRSDVPFPIWRPVAASKLPEVSFLWWQRPEMPQSPGLGSVPASGQQDGGLIRWTVWPWPVSCPGPPPRRSWSCPNSASRSAETVRTCSVRTWSVRTANFVRNLRECPTNFLRRRRRHLQRRFRRSTSGKRSRRWPSTWNDCTVAGASRLGRLPSQEH